MNETQETKEHLIERLKYNPEFLLWDEDAGDSGMYVEDWPKIYAEIERHVLASQWHKVSDGLPEEPIPGQEGAWLVYRLNGIMSITVRITHWMPLPTKPKGESDEM